MNRSASFTDGNDVSVAPDDEVQYRFGARHGILLEVLQDGDALVCFFDTAEVEPVKWTHLCKVPIGYKQGKPNMRTRKYMAGDVVRLKPVTIMEAGDFSGGLRVRAGAHVVGINEDHIESIEVRAFKRGDLVQVDGYGNQFEGGAAYGVWEWGDGIQALVRWDDHGNVQIVAAAQVRPREV